jgi:hypothetical protein
VALEHRAGGVYFYRFRRIGGRVVREYAGCGRVAELAAELHRLDAERQALARQEEADRLDEWQREAGLVRSVLARANEVIAAVLPAAGWHRHNREWRRRRGAAMAADLTTVLKTWVATLLQDANVDREHRHRLCDDSPQPTPLPPLPPARLIHVGRLALHVLP